MDASPEPGSPLSPYANPSQDLLNNLLEGCQVIGRDWRYLYVNDAVARHGRTSKERLLGRTMMAAYPGIEQTPMFAVLRQCMEERTSRQIENEFTFPDGAKGWFELRFEPVPEGVFILSLEITERKRAEARITYLNAMVRGIQRVNQLITREQDRERLIAEACDLLVEERGFHSVVIGLTDASGETVVAHAGAGQDVSVLQEQIAAQQIPVCAREAMASHDVVLHHGAERDCTACPTGAARLADRACLTVDLAHDGRSYGFMVARLRGDLGDAVEEQDLLREVATDIAFALGSIEIAADRDRAAAALAATEAQLRQSQKLEAIGQLAGGVAHDFNNLLTVQMGYCSLLESQLQKSDPLAYTVAEIKAAAQRAAALTRQLLAFSRRQVLQPQVLDLNAVVANIETMLARVIGEDVALVTRLASDLGRAKADAGQIEQVIMNLAVNARDAMPDGGTLTIETVNVVLDGEYVRHHVGAAAGPHVMLAVTDTGRGMDEETRCRLFEPFFTTKPQGKGTGLGLATVYGIVKQSGGNIWVYSEPGEGTTFKIYLPRVDAEPTQRAVEDQRVVRGTGERVLLVEDEAALRSLFAEMIERLGYRVVVAASGAEALRAVEEDGGPFDLLVTDVVMPGMRGPALAERLGEIQPAIKVLYMSGYLGDVTARNPLLDPRTPFLPKPFTMADLAAKMRDALGAA